MKDNLVCFMILGIVALIAVVGLVMMFSTTSQGGAFISIPNWNMPKPAFPNASFQTINTKPMPSTSTINTQPSCPASMSAVDANKANVLRARGIVCKPLSGRSNVYCCPKTIRTAPSTL